MSTRTTFKVILVCRACGLYESESCETSEYASARKAELAAGHVLERDCNQHVAYVEPRLAAAPEVF